jgi:UDP-N-acetylmuramoyl-tripeptide--D-alanyl-D-alanine ligase
VQLTAQEIARRTGGEVVAGDPATLATAFTFDTRAMPPGACFVALRGHRDGHDFVDDAFSRGASVALVSHVREGVHGTAPVLVRVDDPEAALGRLAGSVRADRDDLQVIGVTGSTGKTSTKDLLRAALATTGAAHANRDSFNNEVGLPLTLLEIDESTRYVITEMGARFAGNIRALCAVAQPTIGIVTNIGLAHAEHLGGPEGVARVKGELLEALPADGFAVLNADDPWTPQLASRASCRVGTVGTAGGADWRITDVVLRDDLSASCRVGDVKIEVPLRGAHQVHNAALAVAVAAHLGIAPADIAAGLAAAQGSHWRMELERSTTGVIVLNDAYNANPTSMEAALRALAHLPTDGRRIAVLGEMRELGDHAAGAHAEVGRLVSELEIDLVIGVGEWGGAITAAAHGVASVQVDDSGAALAAVAGRLAPGDAVLVKASRAVGLEAVALGILDRNVGAPGGVVPAAPARSVPE